MPRFFQLFIKKVNIGLFRLMNGFQGSHNSPHIHELLTLETRPNGVVKPVRLSYPLGPARTAVGCIQRHRPQKSRVWSQTDLQAECRRPDSSLRR